MTPALRQQLVIADPLDQWLYDPATNYDELRLRVSLAKPSVERILGLALDVDLFSEEPLARRHFAIGDDKRIRVFALSLAPRGFSTASLGVKNCGCALLSVKSMKTKGTQLGKVYR